MQASEGESENSEGNSDEEERDLTLLPLCYLLPVLPLAVDPVHLLVEMKVLQGAKIKRIGRRRRGRGTMKRGRRMSNLPLHQRTLGRNIQGRNTRGEGSLDRQLVC
jgi:hypothetical protein